MLGKINCVQCGAILDSNNALKNSGNLYCSEQCSEKHRRDSNDKQGRYCC